MSSDDGSSALVYDVLFYKRSSHSKVHKSKGVSKVDGILSLDVANQTISLRCVDGDDEESQSDDDEKKMTWKERRKKTVKAGPRGTVYTGKLQGDLTPNTIQEDATIVIGSFDVEIVSLRRTSTTSAAAARPNSLVSIKKPTIRGLSQKTVPVLTKRTNAMSHTFPVKRKPPPQPIAAQQASRLVKQRKLPAQQPTRAATQNTSVPSVSLKRPLTSNILTKKSNKVGVVAPTQPKTGDLKVAVTASSQRRPRPAWTTPTTTAAAAAVLPHIPLPASIRSVLRPHQVTGVDFLWKALTNDKGAILADEMGLGKTLMSIAIVVAWHRTQRSHSHIVVCPSSLIGNWESEFDKWLGKASQPKRMTIRTGGAEGLQRVRAFAGNQSQKNSHRVGQVLIISYDFFRMHAKVIQQAVDGSIGLLLVDEGHKLKNTNGSLTMTALASIQVEARLLITATPVQNNLSEFYSLVQFVRPGLLGDLATFRKEFERPIAAANRKNASRADRDFATRQSQELEALTSSTILRRLQTEVLGSVLPPRTEILLFCKLSAEQSQLYQSITAQRSKKLSAPSSMSDALEMLTSLRKLCTHPSLVHNAEDQMSLASSSNVEASGKLAVLSILLRQIRATAEDDKVVIVSNFTSALSLIEELILKPLNMSYMRLDGSVSAQNRQALVDTFNRVSASRCFCFLLSAKAGGCGLNLVGANKLIMMDADYNPSTDLQAMGRIYRTGQKRATTIYRLFSTGTLEEIIYQRQLQKGTLASVTVDGREDEIAKFSSDELKEAMTYKSNTQSDTKDKMGAAWGDFDGSIVSGELAESDLVTFAHLVDEEVAQKRSDKAQQSLDQGDNYASDTSEEEFDYGDESPFKATGKKRGSKTAALSDSSDSEKEAEFK